MKDKSKVRHGKCAKGFPKDWQPVTSENEDGYPLYRRRNDAHVPMNIMGICVWPWRDETREMVGQSTCGPLQSAVEPTLRLPHLCRGCLLHRGN